MRKFNEIYKEKLNEAQSLKESKVIGDFRSIYSAMLDQYGIKSINTLDEQTQISFLTELSNYWSEEKGINEKGENFLKKRSISLNENSTCVQKKNYLRVKTEAVINETLRQTELKWKIYNIIDEIYHQIKASSLNEILTPDTITNIISESFSKSLDDFMSNINRELKESAVPKRKYVVKVKKTNV